MPAALASTGGGRAPRVPAVPRIPVVPTRLASAATPRGVGIAIPRTAPTPTTTPNDSATQTLATAANPRGVAIAQRPTPPAYLKTASYQHAVINIFNAQPRALQARIVQAAQRNPTAEGKIVLAYVRSNLRASGPSHGFARAGMTAAGTRAGANGLFGDIEGGINALTRDVSGLAFKSGSGGGDGMASITMPKLPSGVLGTLAGATRGIERVGGTLLKNAGKDAISLPAQAFTTAGTIGGDVLGGHVGKAESDIISPYEQLLKNPGKMIVAHPLDSYLMAAGVLHGASRVVGGAIRAAAPESAAARAMSTERPGIQLAGNLTHERPPYSPSPTVKLGQVAFDRANYKRSPTGALVPRSASLEARLTGLETSRLVGVNERLRRANREATIVQRAKAVTPPLAARLAHGAKTALRYNPDHATIPGAEVLARIADATVRHQGVYKEDLLKHARDIAQTRNDLIDNPKLLAEHDAYVKAITDAAHRKMSPADIKAAFEASGRYEKEYPPTQDEAYALGQFGSRSKDALLKRTLMHYAKAHMDARYDPAIGLVRAGSKAEVRTFVGGLRAEARKLEQRAETTPFDSQRAAELRATIQRAWDQQIVPLGNEDILAHLNGPEGTGGRLPAFTSDRPRRGSAFYVSSERRPLPEGHANTLFAYSHGLTDPSHTALLEQHVRMQGIVDAHKAQNRLVDTLAVMRPDGGAWPSYTAAERDAPPGYRPIALSQPFHPQESLDKALEGTSPMTLDEEAQTHGLDLSDRLTDHGQRRWALADETALKRIKEHEGQITSNPAMRVAKMTTNQMRQVALGTSFRHVPGVAQEQLIRDAASGVGISSWITGRRLLKRAEQLNPELGRRARIETTGGTVAGSTKMMMTRQVSDHFAGTNLHAPLNAFEKFMRTPGPRQLRTAWRTWLRLALNGTKHLIEEQGQTAGVGKAALREFGSTHGPFFKAMRLQGSMLDDAAKGLFDPKKLRQYRAEVERIYGRWTDLTPSGQHAMMLSPFGLWFVNSVKWLARGPIDHPVKTGVLAAATVGTEKERAAKGQDIFTPGALPLYMQGGISLGGGKVLAQNYYSPFGVANDPLETSASLLDPIIVPEVLGAFGDSYYGQPLTSPNNPKGYNRSNVGIRSRYIVDSILSTLVPFYSKAEEIASGGASTYNTSSLLMGMQTKTPGNGPLAGLEKAVTPFRTYGGSSSSSSPDNTTVIPGHGSGSLSDVVIPGHGSGSLSDVVIP